MRKILLLLGLLIAHWTPAFASETASQCDGRYSLVVHGGAGGLSKNLRNDTALQGRYKTRLLAALEAGEVVLRQGGKATEAVTSVIVAFENDPLFNAGKGAVLNADGDVELEASIMDGTSHQTGAVTGLKRVKHPILLAREIMTNFDHVFMTGGGAEALARERHLDLVNNDYFKTRDRIDQWQKLAFAPEIYQTHRFGTVGAVALDQCGNLAAATSTGGRVGKKPGRIGDAPIIGAGTYADSRSCAVSGTGHGEMFIRRTVARDICALVEMKGMTIEEAAHEVIGGRLAEIGGKGGVIAIDNKGNIAVVDNTNRMHRASVRQGEPPFAASLSLDD